MSARDSGSLLEAGGQKLAGRYEIVSLLGAGGMGSVYLARDLELDELVALKTLAHELIDVPGAMERFRREVKLARKVTHKNVARTYDIGEHQGLRFITMEYIEGESLTARIQRSLGLGLEDALAVAHGIGDGLEAAHAAGVVHRDLKPDNVILGKDGRVLITDFGIARAFSQGQANLTAGKPLGTPAYMSPEQVEGKEADHRADIYALGEILFEMLTGVCPFRGDSVFAIAAARLLQPPPNPCEHRVAIPKALGAVVEKAMARDPAARYPDVRAFMSALLTMPAPSMMPPHQSLALGVTQPVMTISAIPAPTPSSPQLDGTKVLAVIPFRNIGAVEDEYLASALSESLVDTLSMSSQLRVPSLAAARAVYKEGEDPRALGERMGAHVVASGSVTRDKDNIRVSARLIGVSDGFQIWARRLEGSVSDVLRLSDQTADAIISGLALERKTVERALPEDPVVLDLYLRAKHLSRSPRNIKETFELLNEALARAPDEPAVLALLAHAHLWHFNFDPDAQRADEAASLARDAATRAIALAPSAALPHMAIAELERSHGNIVEAVRAYGLALKVDPRLADALHNVGLLRARTGDPAGGLRLMKRASLLDPSIAYGRWEQIFVRELIGEPEAADEAFVEPPPSGEKMFPYWLARAHVLLWRRDVEGARVALAVTPNGPPPPAVHMLMAVAHSKFDPAPAEELSRRARVGAASISRTVFFRKISAAVAAVAGQVDYAMQSLIEADAAQLHDHLWLTSCNALTVLRTRPEYPEIEARVRARAEVILEAVKRI